MTEASHQMTCNPLPAGHGQARARSGVAAGIEVAILDAANHVLPRGERGEVAIRGATVVDGYENNPAANEAGVHRRLVPHRRRGHARRRRLPLPHRPAEGADQPRRREDLPARDRRGPPPPPGRRRGRARSPSPTTSWARRSARPSCSSRATMPPRRELRDVPARAARPLQGAQADRLRRRDPQGRHRQDPTHRPRREASPSSRARVRSWRLSTSDSSLVETHGDAFETWRGRG